MSFAKQLETLLDICRVSNAALARGLGVDASLISRWKTGNRLPPQASQVARAIAVFLSEIPLKPREKSYLTETLGSEAVNTGLASAIEKFLLDVPVTSDDTAYAELDTLIENLFKPLRRDGAAAPRGPVNLWPRVKKGQPLEHEAFFGVDGKRQAAINLLYTAISASRPTELYLLLPEDIGWVIGDPTFSDLFFQALYVFTQRGGAISVIHRRPEDTPEGLASLSRFMPHYLTGRVFSYSLPGERHPPAPALFVVKGLCATITLREDPKDEMTVLYRSAADAARYEGLFREYLADARPLVQAYDVTDALAMSSALAELEKRSGDCFVATRALNPLWAPDALLRELAGTWPTALSQLARRREMFVAQTSRWMELWPEELLHSIERTGVAPLAMGPLNGQPNCVLTGESLKLYLSGFIHILRQVEGFHVLLSSSLLNIGYLAYKKRVGALLFPQLESPSSALLLRGEQTLSLVEKWFASCAAAHDKRKLITRLEAALSQLGATRETA